MVPLAGLDYRDISLLVCSRTEELVADGHTRTATAHDNDLVSSGAAAARAGHGGQAPAGESASLGKCCAEERHAG